MAAPGKWGAAPPPGICSRQRGISSCAPAPAQPSWAPASLRELPQPGLPAPRPPSLPSSLRPGSSRGLCCCLERGRCRDVCSGCPPPPQCSQDAAPASCFQSKGSLQEEGLLLLKMCPAYCKEAWSGRTSHGLNDKQKEQRLKFFKWKTSVRRKAIFWICRPWIVSVCMCAWVKNCRQD